MSNIWENLVSAEVFLLSIMMFLSVVPNRKLPSQKIKIRPQRDSNPYFLIRSQTPYPLGHSAIEMFSKWVDLKRSGCLCCTAKMSKFF